MRSLRDLIVDINMVHLVGSADQPITGVAYDSRKVEPGHLFVAIRGTHTDGHRYIESVLARGAAALLVDERFWQPDSMPVPVAVVPNSLVALAPVAAAWYGYPGRELGVVGITGTKGKTTTTELTSRVVEGGDFSTGMIGTLDFKIGPRQWPNDTRQSTPEALEVQQMLREMVAAGCDYAVIEATSHALSDRWNRLGCCDFDVALFLNVTHEHLDFHGTVEQYRRDKARLFELLGEGVGSGEWGQGTGGRVGREKWAIVNADDPHHQLYLDSAPPAAGRLTFGVRSPADIRAHDVVATPEGTRARVTTPWGVGALTLRLPGVFNLINGLAAVSVGLSQGIPLDRCLAALAEVEGVRGRMQPVALGQPFAVLVDYAHNPDSFEQVMAMLHPLTQGRMIAVFGSAGERDRAKRPMQGAIAARYCQLLVLTDEDPRGEDREVILAEIAAGAEPEGLRAGTGYVCIPDRTEAVRYAIAQAQPGDLVLLLGKGHEGSIQYDGYNIPWDEAAVARAALQERGYGIRGEGCEVRGERQCSSDL